MTALALPFCPCFYSPGHCWPLLLPWFAVGPSPSHCPPGPTGPFPQTCSLGSFESVLLQRILWSIGRTLHLPLLNFLLSQSAHSSRPLGVAVVAQFHVFAHWVKKGSAPSSHPLVKILNRSSGQIPVQVALVFPLLPNSRER